MTDKAETEAAVMLAALGILAAVWLFRTVRPFKIARDLFRGWTRLPLAGFLFAGLLGLVCLLYGGEKYWSVSNIVEDLQSILVPEAGPPGGNAPMSQSSEPRLTANQCAAGFALVGATTNALPWPANPETAILHSRWTLRGAAEDTFWLPATNWSFILGSNSVGGVHVSSSGTLSFGGPKGSPRPAEMPDATGLNFLAPLQASFDTAPPEGRFWHAVTDSNSVLFTWENVFAGRETNSPVTFQAELFWNGDFVYRYAFTNSPALTNFAIGAQNNGGGETYALSDTNRLANGLELRWRAFGILDPNIDDHDGDGISTYEEVMVWGTDPRMPDTDLDGLSDSAELAAGTDPRNPDTDGDGLADGSDPRRLAWDDADADADGDGFPLWQELFYGTSDTVYGDVQELFPSDYRALTFTVSGPLPRTAVLKIGDFSVPVSGRASFTLRFLPDTVRPMAFVGAPGASVAISSQDCFGLADATGGLAAGGKGPGAASLVLPVVSAGNGNVICLHAGETGATARVTANLPGTFEWFRPGGLPFGGSGASVSLSGIPSGQLGVNFYPAAGGACGCGCLPTLARCKRGGFCDHGLPWGECQVCSAGGGNPYWCYIHGEPKPLCPCLTLDGTLNGALRPSAVSEYWLRVGTEEDTDPGWGLGQHCCNCPEHQALGAGPTVKTNVVRSVSQRLRLWLSPNGTGAVSEGDRLAGPTSMFPGAAAASAHFGDAFAAFSHELHPEPEGWQWVSFTAAAIRLAPETAGGTGRGLIRGGTNCVSRVSALTDSALEEGSLRLACGGGLFLSETQGTHVFDALTVLTNAPPGSVAASRDIWLGATNGGLGSLTYSLLRPDGTVFLTTNLAVEAVMVKLATNAYCAAYGSSETLGVGLAAASHDPQGYSLSVDGEEVDWGSPQWYVDTSCLTAGVHTLTVRSETFPDMEDSAVLRILKIDINGDYNRDGNPADDPHEDDAVTFDGQKGMVILANTDDDVADQTKQPDCKDGVINGANDLADIYALKLAKLGIPVGDIPAGLTLELSVGNPPGEPSGAPDAKDRVRVFRSRSQDAQGVVGPDPLTDKVVFKKNPGSSDMDIDLLGGAGDLEMGIEGVEYGREVIVKLVLKLNGQEIGSDSIRLLVAPFLVLSNIAPTSKVFIGADASEYGWSNFYETVSSALVGVVPLESYCPMSYIQDKAEIGYARSAPGQTERKQNAVMGLEGDWFKELLDADTGYFQNQTGIAGGNLEASPPIDGFGYGRLIVGAGLPSSTKEFFKAQKVQTDSGNLIELPVDWLAVGHVDEVFTVIPCGTGFRILVADLQSAIDLIRTNSNCETEGDFPTRENMLADYDNPSYAQNVALIKAKLAIVRSTLAQTLGISEEAIIKIPVAFTVGGNTHVKTSLPNMINMLAVTNANDQRRLVIPYPFFQPFASYINDLLISLGYQTNETAFVDTAALHSPGGGETHCATLSKRTEQ